MSLQKPHLPDAFFNKDRHVKFWLRCSTLLPEPYTSGDSTRLSFAYFIVAGLDLIGILDTHIKPELRQSWIDWIYDCQTTTGGFRGSPTMSLGLSRNHQNGHWDPGNLPSTFFALITLLILGDDFSRIRREECLSWLSKLQRPDGSFGEFLFEHDSIQGSHDLRHCMCASAIAFLLQGPSNVRTKPHLPFDEDTLRQYIMTCQAYDGGFAEAPFREAHSGLNYCAIATLTVLDRLRSQDKPTTSTTNLPPPLQTCLKWILDRQTTWLQEASSDTDSEDDDVLHTHPASMAPHFSSTSHLPDPYAPETVTQPFPFNPLTTLLGFNGRHNKIADTCYSFWNTGALACLLPAHLSPTAEVGPSSLTALPSTSTSSTTAPSATSSYITFLYPESMKAYLLSLTQHPTLGGFSKMPGYPPDILHSYLGLATLSLLAAEELGLKEIDPAFAVSKDTLGRLEAIWERWRGSDLEPGK